MSSGPPPSLNLSFTNLSIEEKVQTERWKLKSAKDLEIGKLLADELRDQIRQEDGIEPGSTPILGNSGERKIIKSSNGLPAMCGGGSAGGGGDEIENSLGAIKKSLSFGHVEITEIVKITKEDEHKNTGQDSPTIFNGFIETEKIKINLDPLPKSED